MSAAPRRALIESFLWNGHQVKPSINILSLLKTYFDILLRTLSFGVNVEETVSSSLTESLSPPRSRGTEEEELPETWGGNKKIRSKTD